MKNLFFLSLIFISILPGFSQNNQKPGRTIVDSSQTITRIERYSTPFSAKDKGIKIFPNPTDGELTIEYEFSSGNESIEFLDILGNKVLELKYQKEIDVSILTRGIYFLRLLDGYKRLIVMERIIKK